MWKPTNSPSNRDRLELYALHKQAVSGGSPQLTDVDLAECTLAERAKRKAWYGKRGMNQAQAMAAYMTEADRQMQMYGSSMALQEVDAMSAASSTTSTSVLLTPRGLAAVPLLCAAAAEPRKAFLSRTSSHRRWWQKQEPLCVSLPSEYSVLALPEQSVIWIGTQIEAFSAKYPNGPVWHSYLWPIHNVTLVMWMAIVLVSSFLSTAVILARILVLGRNRTGVSLPEILHDEIVPFQYACQTLLQPHQAISVRLLGLLFMPAIKLCEVTINLHQRNFSTQAASVHILLCLGTIWYWTWFMAFMAYVALVAALNVGVCFAIIQIAQEITA